MSFKEFMKNGNPALDALAEAAETQRANDMQDFFEEKIRKAQKKRYLVLFDNLVTDDVIIRFIHASSVEECWEIAYPISKQTGLSEGNFEIFVSVDELEG